jgi:hypothetical protein
MCLSIGTVAFISVTQRRMSTTLLDSMRKPSPVVLMSRPENPGDNGDLSSSTSPVCLPIIPGNPANSAQPVDQLPDLAAELVQGTQNNRAEKSHRVVRRASRARQV